MSTSPATPNKYLSKQYRDGVYIPAGLLIVGCAIAKRDWVPYAILLAAALAGYKVWSMREYTTSPRRYSCKLSFPSTDALSRRAKGSQAYRIPRLCAKGEDHRLAQCSHVRNSTAKLKAAF
jgi:hypothetical protein